MTHNSELRFSWKRPLVRQLCESMIPPEIPRAATRSLEQSRSPGRLLLTLSWAALDYHLVDLIEASRRTEAPLLRPGVHDRGKFLDRLKLVYAGPGRLRAVAPRVARHPEACRQGQNPQRDHKPLRAQGWRRSVSGLWQGGRRRRGRRARPQADLIRTRGSAGSIGASHRDVGGA